MFSHSYAQVSNDVCANAITLSMNSSCVTTSGTLQGATTSSLNIGCTYYYDVFYKFVATSSSGVITLTSGSLDATLSLFTGCSATSNLYCVDNGGSGGTEAISFSGLSVGTTYYISVQNYYSTLPSTPTFNICVSYVAPPSNDMCASAITLIPGVECNTITGTLNGANTNTSPSGCSSSYSDVFYKFVANSTTADLTVTSSSSIDLKVSVFNSCSATSSLYCVDYTLSGQAELVSMSNLVVGNTYYIKVADYYNTTPSSASTFTVCVKATNVTSPANDNCANAINLTPTSTCSPTSGTIQFAYTSTTPTGCSGNSDVYYKFTANSNVATITVAPSSSFDPMVSVFTSCAATSSLTCVDNGIDGGTETVNLSNLSIGTVYYVKVADYGTSLPSSTSFTICAVSGANNAPSNDNCAGATSLTPATTCTPTSGTVQFASTASTPSDCSGNSDVFYKFVANSSTAEIRVVPSSGLDPVVGVFSSCTALSSIDCVDNGGNGTSETVNLTGLTNGSTYYIKVSDYSTSLPSTFDFTICVISTPVNTTPPANDNCANAILITPSSYCVNTAGTLLNATTSTSNANDDCTGNSDVYYKFVANATSATITVDASDGIDGVIGVYSSCSTASLECIDNGLTNGVDESGVVSGLTPGNTYYIKVQDFASALPSTFDFNVCVVSTSSGTTPTQSASVLKSIALYPNPAANSLSINKITETTKVEIVDVSGNVVWTEMIDSDTTIDITDLTAGMYLVKLIRDDISDTRRVVVVK